MKIKLFGNLVTVTVFDKKDKETKEVTGEKGLKNISLLVDKTQDYALSGEVIHPYLVPEYIGPFDFSDFERLQPVEVEVDMSVYDGKTSYKLLSLTKIQNKK